MSSLPFFVHAIFLNMPKVVLLFLFLFWVLIELYTNHLLSCYPNYLRYSNWASILIILSTCLSVYLCYENDISTTIGWVNVLMGLSIAFFASKLVFCGIHVLEDVFRIGQFGIEKTLGKAPISLHSRRSFIHKLSLFLAGSTLLSFLWGVFYTRYNFHVIRKKIHFKRLPKPFHKFKIVQLSDLHIGSFDSFKAVESIIEKVNALKPDIILFTGDLVNNLATEFDPYVDVFKQLEAKHGKYAVLGNHDYGLYMDWPTNEEKHANRKAIREHYQQAGFNLLNNRHVSIPLGTDKIIVAGVENWGRPTFPSKGDLPKALQGTAESDFIVLMSHDPHHWEDVVLSHQLHVDLTLSGHTHGMQFGVEIGSFQWSPIKYVYKHWAGLYQQQGKRLYVNRGLGHLGFPGRVGIRPEITLIELSVN